MISFCSFKFTSFDESKCNWNQIQQDDCDLKPSTLNSIRTTIQTTIPSTSASTYSTTKLYSSPFLLNNLHETTNQKVISDQNSCDSSQLNSSWECSNDSKNNSKCTKNCGNGGYERKKCLCDRRSCSWIRDSLECDVNTSIEPFTEVPDDPSTTDILRSFIQSMKLINKGEINVNFQLR